MNVRLQAHLIEEIREVKLTRFGGHLYTWAESPEEVFPCRSICRLSAGMSGGGDPAGTQTGATGKPHAKIARELGMTGATLRLGLKQTDLDDGKRQEGLASDEQEEMRRLRRENRRVARGARNHERSRSLLRFGFAQETHSLR